MTELEINQCTVVKIKFSGPNCNFYKLFSCHVLQVEALKGFRVTDCACGSGDAQTLCITDDDCVWSWGDGDYGKLGKHYRL